VLRVSVSGPALGSKTKVDVNGEIRVALRAPGLCRCIPRA